jgi:hypothetical protein
MRKENDSENIGVKKYLPKVIEVREKKLEEREPPSESEWEFVEKHE